MMKRIFEHIVKQGGSPLIVGGYVRDKHYGVESKDIDVEVYGLPAERLIDILSCYGKTDEVGMSFGVIKLTTDDGQQYDFTLPRRENKVGQGHKGFQVEVDHTMTPREAAKRRDFTINSVAEDYHGTLIDPYCGIRDMELGLLRATSLHYQEDPLRVLRGMQFCGRFGLTGTESTIRMSKRMGKEFFTISLERIREEWVKWAMKSKYPSKGLFFLQDCGWTRFFPALEKIVGLPQDPEWHPEGCVYTHTAHVCDAAARIAVRENLSAYQRLILMLSALCHDLGKASTTEVKDGRFVAPGHDKAGEEPTRDLLKCMGFAPNGDIANEVVALVKEHMVHIGLQVSDRTVRRLASRVHPSNIRMLSLLCEADHSGRPPLAKGMPEGFVDILAVAERLRVEDAKPKPLVMGRHLIQVGLKPGPHFGPLLDSAYQGQLDGEFGCVEDGLEYLAEMS